MKKTLRQYLIPTLLLLGILSTLTSCGSSADAEESYDAINGYAKEDYSYMESEEMPALADEEVEKNTGGTSDGLVQQSAGQIDTDKIIRTARAEVESVEFDKAVEKINQLASDYAGYFDATSIGGRSYEESYYGYQSYRTASFTLRVPKENFFTVTEAMSEIGNLISINTTAENVTGQYTDTESRLKTYRTEEERLLAMLEKAETVEDMLNIEDRLAMVCYEIESLTTSLKQLDNKIYYCTVEITLREVYRYTEVEEPDKGYWETMADGFVRSLKDVGQWFADAAQFIVIELPVIVTVAVLAAVGISVVLLIDRRQRRKRIEKQKKREAEASQEAKKTDL